MTGYQQIKSLILNLNHLRGDKSMFLKYNDPRNLSKSNKVCWKKHKNQKVPGTESNYLLHISNVAMEILLAYNANNNFDIDFAI